MKEPLFFLSFILSLVSQVFVNSIKTILFLTRVSKFTECHSNGYLVVPNSEDLVGIKNGYCDTIVCGLRNNSLLCIGLSDLTVFCYLNGGFYCLGFNFEFKNN